MDRAHPTVQSDSFVAMAIDDSTSTIEDTDELSERSTSAIGDVNAVNSILQWNSNISNCTRHYGSSRRGTRVEETFFCQICYDHAPVSDARTLNTCGHRFCGVCLTNYIELEIREGRVYPKCFFTPTGGKPCLVEIAPSDIQTLVSEKVWMQYTKFKFNKENDRARQCPYCDHSQICQGIEQPICRCEKCHKEFCFKHSTAHVGRTCAVYEKEIAGIERLNQAIIRQISKPCPGCKNDVEKTGGCDRMKCTVCKTNFCWVCGATMENTAFPDHYQMWSNNMCRGSLQAGQGFSLFKVFRIIVFVLFAIPAAAITLVLSALCCGFACCRTENHTTFRQEFRSACTVISYLLMAPVMSLVATVGAVLAVVGGIVLLLAAIVASPLIYIATCLFPNLVKKKSSTNDSDEPKTPNDVAIASVTLKVDGHAPGSSHSPMSDAAFQSMV